RLRPPPPGAEGAVVMQRGDRGGACCPCKECSWNCSSEGRAARSSGSMARRVSSPTPRCSSGSPPPAPTLPPPDARVLERLAAHGHLLAPSHPGFGHSPEAASIDTVDDLAYLYLDLLAQRG